MTVIPRTRRIALLMTTVVAMLIVSVNGQEQAAPQRSTAEPGFRFRSGVELITVTATVTDQTGRFVPGLRQEDFVVYEDDQPVEVSHFSAERVPVSLGIVLDTSSSMAGEKIREALGRSIASPTTCSTSAMSCSSTGSATIPRWCRGGRPTGS